MADEQVPSNVSAVEHMSVSDADLLARWSAPAQETTEQVEPADKPDIKVVEQPKVEEEEVVEKEPETKVEETKEPEPEETEEEKPKPVLVTKFSVHDERGELEIPTNLKFSFKANGKDYEDVPIDKVVNFAQMGIYNHEREQKFSAIEKQAQATVEELEQYKQAVKEYEHYFNRMVESDDFVEKVREEFGKLNSPDVARQQLQVEREQLQREKEDQYAAAFTAQRLTPAIQKLLDENPTVNQYELLGRFNELTAPMMVRGRIPVGRLEQVQRTVESDLATWAKSLHSTRALEADKRAKEAETVKKELVKAKKQVARVTAPNGSVGSSTNQLPKPKSAADWFNNRMGFNTED